MSSAFNTKIILLNLLKIYNQTGQEKYISTVILRWLKKHNIDFNVDKTGNIYNFKHLNAPFLNAHLDSVQRDCDKMAGLNLTMNSNLIIKSEGHIIGGDDLVGIYIILYLLSNTDLKFNWIFTMSEEVNGIGSTAFVNENSKLLTNSSYGIVIDRKGSNDIICSNNSYGTKEFENKLFQVGKNFKFSPGTGTWSDANNWRNFVSCANLSCGYYEAHTPNEYVKLTDVFNTINYIKAILSTIKEKFEKPKILYYENYGSDCYGNYNDYYESNYQQKMKNKNFIDKDEVFEEEKDNYEKKCICCGREESFHPSYTNEYTWINILNGFVCNSCILELYDELDNEITKQCYY